MLAKRQRTMVPRRGGRRSAVPPRGCSPGRPAYPRVMRRMPRRAQAPIVRPRRPATEFIASTRCGHAADRPGTQRGVGRLAQEQRPARRGAGGGSHHEPAMLRRPPDSFRLPRLRSGRPQRLRQVDGVVRLRLRLSRTRTRVRGLRSRTVVPELHQPATGRALGPGARDRARLSLPAPGRSSFHALEAGKVWSRSGSLPEREVYLRTLANLTSPSEVRSILQLGRKEVRTEAISPDLLIFAHRILPWRYHSLDLISGQSTRDLPLLRAAR